MRKFHRYPKRRNSVQPSSVVAKPIQKPSLPEKRHTDLAEFLKVNGAHNCGFLYRNHGWFENAHYIFHPDYDEDGACLTFAQSKDMYFVQSKYSSDSFLDLEEIRFDSRFIFPDLFLQGTLRFGNYHDNQLGRIFFLTEPKDANDVLLSVSEPSGIGEWLKNDPNVKYFYHEPKRYQLHVILPVGSRIDFDHEFVITHPTSPSDDREFFSRLFQEKLRHAVDFNVIETAYVRPLSEAEQESKAHRADYADRLAALSEKYREICRIRLTGSSDPFEDPVSVYYKGYRYFYNDVGMSRLEVVVDTDYEFYQNLASRIDFVETLIRNGLTNICEEFDVDVTLRLEREIHLANLSEEAIALSVHQVDKPPRHCDVIHRRSISLDEFNAPSPGGVAESFIVDVERFFDRYREKFHAFKKLYETNLSYHSLVNLNSLAPELDYNYIFSDINL